MADAMVELKDVKRVYGTKNLTCALRGVSFKVNHGEFAAIVGPSGSGKSTLLNLIGALDKPSEGDVFIAGQSLKTMDDTGLATLRRKNLGFVFQFHYLLPDFTVLENVLMPYFLDHGTPTSLELKQAKSLLERVGLHDRMDNRSVDLSGGQQQRVAIARALAAKKPLVLADEPTGNLDTTNSHEIFRLMCEFNQQDGTTFLLVTHDTLLAKQTDRVITVVDGLIESDVRI